MRFSFVRIKYGEIKKHSFCRRVSVGPYLCEECGTDFTPVWRAIGADENSLNLYCDACVKAAQKKKMRQEHIALLRKAFNKVMEKEQVGQKFCCCSVKLCFFFLFLFVKRVIFKQKAEPLEGGMVSSVFLRVLVKCSVIKNHVLWEAGVEYNRRFFAIVTRSAPSVPNFVTDVL